VATLGARHFGCGLDCLRQFSSQNLSAAILVDEFCVKVFNSSVENRVEKASAKFEIAGQYGAYSSLHQIRATRPSNFFLAESTTAFRTRVTGDFIFAIRHGREPLREFFSTSEEADRA
jgi:hypothetical protein